MNAVRDDRAKYDAAGVTVFAINNQGAASHKAFSAKHGLDTPLLVDHDFTVASAYDAVMGIGPLRLVNRTVVGIAPTGTVTYYKHGLPPTDEILAAVAP
ncbi:MAG: hypothetical protein NVS3B17_01440 [Vulcanimicrobiaceae bacterium]